MEATTELDASSRASKSTERDSSRARASSRRVVALPVDDGGSENGASSKTVLASLLRQIKSQAKYIFEDNIPHEYVQLLTTGRRLTYGSVLYTVAVAIVAALFWWTFTQTLKTETLSTVQTTTKCQPVDRPSSGSFLADFDGNWVSTQSFDPSQAVYELQLNNFSAIELGANEQQTRMSLPEFYASKMDWVGSVLKGTVTSLLTTNDLAHNLLYLMFWRLQFYTGVQQGELNIQEFSFTATPSSIFGPEYEYLTGTGDAQGACQVIPRTLWLDSSFIIEWDHASYLADRNCMRSLPPEMLGYSKGRTVDTSIRLVVDSRALLAAVAANYPRQDPKLSEHSLYNYGSNNSLSLRLIYGSEFIYPNPPQPPFIKVGQYYDERYPGMPAIYCIRKYGANGLIEEDKYTCLLKMGLIFALPIWNHFGEGKPDGPPVPCKCPRPDLGDADPCQDFDFLSGLVFFTSDSKGQPFAHMTQVIGALMAMDPTNVAGNSLNSRAFNASWYTPPRFLLPSQGSQYDRTILPPNLLQDPITRRKAFDFCATPLGNCTILVVRSINPLSKITLNKASPTYLILQNGACSASRLFNETSWAHLTSSAPVPLTEAYYRCYPDAPSAAFVATGASLANARAIVPVVVLFLINALWLWQTLTGSSPPRMFSRQEKDQVLDALASRVLLCRYSKLKDLVSVIDDDDFEDGGQGVVDRIPRHKSMVLQFSPLIQKVTEEVEANLSEFSTNGIVHTPEQESSASVSDHNLFIRREDNPDAILRVCRRCGQQQQQRQQQQQHESTAGTIRSNSTPNVSLLELNPLHGKRLL